MGWSGSPPLSQQPPLVFRPVRLRPLGPGAVVASATGNLRSSGAGPPMTGSAGRDGQVCRYRLASRDDGCCYGCA